MQKNIHFFTKLSFYLASFLFTIFVFASTVEVVANFDVPFINTLTEMQNTKLIDGVEQKLQESYYVNKIPNEMISVNKFNYISIPLLQIKSPIKKAIRDAKKNKWLHQPSFVHYIQIDKNKDESQFALYTKQSPLTIPDGFAIKEGMTITLTSYDETKKQDFFVNEINIVSENLQPIIKKTTQQQIILFVEDDKAGRIFIYSLITL